VPTQHGTAAAAMQKKQARHEALKSHEPKAAGVKNDIAGNRGRAHLGIPPLDLHLMWRLVQVGHPPPLEAREPSGEVIKGAARVDNRREVVSMHRRDARQTLRARIRENAPAGGLHIAARWWPSEKARWAVS
jgi:hypothetical protein